LETEEVKEAAVTVEQSHAELGLVLTDLTLTPVAFDRGAAAILGRLDARGFRPVLASGILRDLQQAIRNVDIAEFTAICLRFRIGARDYKCRVFRVDLQNHAAPQPLLALYLERDWSGHEAVCTLSSEFRLTAREQEALRGIAIGLTTKELAERMDISPNTVKAFLRLIMIKLGVTTRGGIIAKLLQYNGYH
jgi:DNA-binding CsgD family transcriptional regulator